MKVSHRLLRGLVLFVLLHISFTSFTQVLDGEGKVQVTLNDGTQVTLFKQRSNPRNYYYLPASLKLGSKPDGTPEFLFVKYTTEDREDAGGVNGAIMHFLMEWGFNETQRRELQQKLSRAVPGATVKGAVPLEADENNGSFAIVSATLSGEDSPGVITSGRAPLIEGGKAAVASKLDKNSAQLLVSTFEEASSISDLSMVLNYNYTVQVPAIKATLIIHWEKIYNAIDSVGGQNITEERNFLGLIRWNKVVGYEETRKAFDQLENDKLIELRIEQNINTEQTDMVMEAIFQYFTNIATETSVDAEDMALSTVSISDTIQIPQEYYGRNYLWTREKISQRASTQEVKLEEIRFAVTKSHQLVGNLSSWYDGVRNNEKCIYSINLNDPFYQHRDIRFVLDLEAREMFDEGVNYVTVNVKKQRSAGNNFETHFTIDEKFITENGVTMVKTYARGEDQNPSIYEYQTQWSLRGGNVYPQSPRWQKGSWEGVTLIPPVTTRDVELEADLNDLSSSGISRVTAELRYKQFGKEQQALIHVSPAKGTPIESKKIFYDRDSKGYVYRLILNHKTEGKLVLDWETKINDNYIYAVIPEDLYDPSSQVFQEAKAKAEEVDSGPEEQVLDKFSNVFEN